MLRIHAVTIAALLEDDVECLHPRTGGEYMRRWWKRRDDELNEELQTHLRMDVRRRVEAGESVRDAEEAARREFGNLGMVREVTRQMWGWGWLERAGQDVRFALRMFRRSP